MHVRISEGRALSRGPSRLRTRHAHSRRADRHSHCAPSDVQAFKRRSISKLERLDSEHLRERMHQKEKSGCELFELDMNNAAAFGTCRRCGRPRAEHTQAALHAGTPAEQKMRKVRDDQDVRKGFVTVRCHRRARIGLAHVSCLDAARLVRVRCADGFVGGA